MLRLSKMSLLDFFDSLKNTITFAPQVGQKSSLCSPHALLCKALRGI